MQLITIVKRPHEFPTMAPPSFGQFATKYLEHAKKHTLRSSSNSSLKVKSNYFDSASKESRIRQRTNSELDAAIALHKAGISCKVKKSVVCAVTGWSRATLYRRISNGLFPKPLKHDRGSWWWISDVLDSV